MHSRSNGQVVVGGASAAIGAALLATGFTAPPFVRGQFLETPMLILVLTAGLVLTLAGALILLFTIRRPEELAPQVPAHIAFNSRMTLPDLAPMSRGTAAVASGATTSSTCAAPGVDAGGAQSALSARLPAPAPTAQRRVAAIKEKDDMARVDAEIRELTRKINKAGVMLATGQLSQQGYLAYVEDLKRQRGKLEVIRVRYELRS